MCCLSKNLLFLAALCLVFGFAVVAVEAGPKFENKCSDGVDNDGDGDVDCADGDCSADPDCQSSGCELFFYANFDDEKFVTSDGEWCSYPDYQYCDDRRQKVAITSQVSPNGARFTLDTQTSSKGTRKATVDLTSFSGRPFDQSEVPINLGFFWLRGGLNLCELCVPGPGCNSGCYMGNPSDVEKLDEVPCLPVDRSSMGVVPYYLNFPVEGALEDRMSLLYNWKWEGEERCPNGVPGVVERTGPYTWVITGSLACLWQGYSHTGNLVDEDGAGNADFTLTITQIQ